jgi:PAS domain S-box-containing protein
MALTSVMGFLQNAALLIAMAVVFDLALARRDARARAWNLVLLGSISGVLAGAIMLTPAVMQGGVRLDARGVLLSLTAVYLGPLAAVTSVAIAAAVRAALGGAGAFAGILWIVASAAIGLAWRMWRRAQRRAHPVRELLLLGISVHVAMIAALFAVSVPLARTIFGAVWMPALLVLPASTLAMGLLFESRLARERTARQLAVSEQKYRLLFKSSPQPMWVFDLETLRFLAVNDAAVAQYGFTRDEFLAMTIRDIRPAEDLPLLDAAVRDVRSGVKNSGIWRHRCRDGRVIQVEIRSHSIAFEGRNAQMVLACDVTEQQRSARERDRLVTAIEQAGETVLITDLEGHIEYANPTAVRTSGYALHELIGQNPRMFKSGIQGEPFYRELWATLRAGETWRGRLVNRRKDGRHYSEDAAISPVRDADGHVTGYVAVKRDVTARLELESQFLQVQKLEMVGRLASGVAHDFNNLLTVIDTSVDLAAMSIAEDHPLQGDLAQVREASERASALTRQLLLFSRKQVRRAVRLDLSVLVRDFSRMLTRLVGDEVRIDLALSNDPWRVLADGGHVEQVVLNLVVNARDAMPQGGVITIGTANHEVHAADAARHLGIEPGDYVALSVRDTGVGMSEETRARIFEPFFTTKTEGGGTGLGLSTVFDIATNAGGVVLVDSQPGAGAEFRMLLPRAV